MGFLPMNFIISVLSLASEPTLLRPAKNQWNEKWLVFEIVARLNVPHRQLAENLPPADNNKMKTVLNFGARQFRQLF
jgi:hypothetical protein